MCCSAFLTIQYCRSCRFNMWLYLVSTPVTLGFNLWSQNCSAVGMPNLSSKFERCTIFFKLTMGMVQTDGRTDRQAQGGPLEES